MKDRDEHFRVGDQVEWLFDGASGKLIAVDDTKFVVEWEDELGVQEYPIDMIAALYPAWK